MIKNLIAFFSLVIVISFCLSCDGRDRIHKSPETVLKENKLLDSFSEKITYIPDGFAEKITDTIYANGYRVYLKQYTNTTKEIAVTSKEVTKQTKTVYKDFNVDLKVSFNGEKLHKKTLNSSSEIIRKHLFTSTQNNYFLRNVWTNAIDEHQPKSPCIILEFYNPLTLDTKSLTMTFLKDVILYH